MKRNLTKFFNLIKNDKQAKTLMVIGLLMLFIFTIGYSLSMFTNNNSSKIANIKVNDLSFNITTNSGESNDRILHLQAGKLEKFNVNLTNLNNIDVNYELIYELCNDSNCISSSKDIPSDLIVYRRSSDTKVSGILESQNSYTMTIITKNDSINDYYIKLNLNAGYIWNDLELANQFKSASSTTDTMNIISYVDGVEVGSLPTSCSYKVIMEAFNSGIEVSSDSLSLTCNYYTNKWTINFSELDVLPDTIKLNFTTIDVPADALIKDFAYINPTTDYLEPYYVYKVPTDGVYKLETWGAQGGSVTNIATGGFGGYSVGKVSLKKGELLYIYIGGNGSGNCKSGSNGTAKYCSAGYNGGGRGLSSDYCGTASGGGGATHISKSVGLLNTLKNEVDNILIVSGGGGGASYYSYDGNVYTGKAGSAGGFEGVSGYSNSSKNSTPGNQTSGYKFGEGYASAFTPSGYNTRSGGGGGYYGGNGAEKTGGAGGSSYIGNSLLKDKAMYCYGCRESIEYSIYTINTEGTNETLDKTNCPNGYSSKAVSKCAKSGSGYARITFINDGN